MLRKEIIDTIRTSVTSIVFFLMIIVFSFIGIRFSSAHGISFNELLCYMIEVAMLLISLFLGSGLFAEEKNQKSFEYLFSLKLSRQQILLYKILPRLASMFVFLVLYILFVSVIAKFPLLLKSSIFIPLFFAVFFFFSSMSLMNKNNTLNIIYNIVIFAGIYAIIIFISNIGFFLNIFDDVLIAKALNLSRVSIQMFLILSIVFFVGFVITFKKVDLSNMSNLFLKKYLVKIGFIVIGLFLFFIVINQLDVPKNPKAFTLKDLQPATFDKDNGYYRLCTLLEPSDANIESEKMLLKYRHYHDPQFDNDMYLKGWKRLPIKGYFGNNKKWADLLDESNVGDMCEHILKVRENILSLKSDYKILLQRYLMLIKSPVFEDFTKLNWTSPIPNLLAWLKAAKLYIAVNMLDALEGNWKEGVANILGHVRFCKRAVKGSRVLVTNLIGKAVSKISLWALSAIMNHQDCPQEVIAQILRELPPIKYEEFGTRNCFIAEYLTWDLYLEEEIYKRYKIKTGYFLFHLFLQKNRTKKYFFESLVDLIDYEKNLPLKRDFYFQEKFERVYKRKLNSWLWWVQNPVGKVIMKNYSSPNFLSVVMKSYHLKTLYDMIRISAEFHLNYTSEKTIQEILNGLKTYQTLLDPCSGKPYIYNKEKQILYSIGTDLDDDGGKEDKIISLDTDFVLPLVSNNKM